jgi:hypothetical protein
MRNRIKPFLHTVSYYYSNANFYITMDKVYAEYIRLSYKILEVMLKPFHSMYRYDTYTNNLSIFLSWSNFGPDLECLKR